MSRIFLVGFMGVGKTTLGMALAKKAGFSFLDLDAYIEDRMQQSIRQLYTALQEEKFRLLEKQMLHEVAEMEDVVISTGGGTPCFFDNMLWMNKRGKTVFLQATLEVLFARLKVGRETRPLLANLTDMELKRFIDSRLKERLPFYQLAVYSYSSDHLESLAELDNSVEELLDLLAEDKTLK